MRLPSSTGALLALLFLNPPAERQEPNGRAATPAPRANEVELAVEWVSAPGPVADSGVWRAGFRVSNRGGGASGPVQLRLRTPLGLIAQRQLTVNLASRLESSVAKPGTIIIGPHTASLVDLPEIKPLPAVALKNIEQLVSPFEVPWK